MNPVRLHAADSSLPVDAWQCGRCGDVYSIDSGLPEHRSQYNSARAAACCTCYRCGRPLPSKFGRCVPCEAERRSAGPGETVEFLEGYSGPVWHDAFGFAGSAAKLAAWAAKLPDVERPTWASIAGRDPKGVADFDGFLRDLSEDDRVDTGRLDPASVAELRAAFSKFNAANASETPLVVDSKRAVRITDTFKFED